MSARSSALLFSRLLQVGGWGRDTPLSLSSSIKSAGPCLRIPILTTLVNPSLFESRVTDHCNRCTWGVQVLRSPKFFSGMEADRNVKVVGGDMAVL